MAEFKNVSFSYGEKQIIKNLSFSVDSGTSTAILGPSGCGKTTLFSLLSGFLNPESGSISSFSGKASFIFQEDRLDDPFNGHLQQYGLSIHSLSRYKNLFSMSSK